MNTSYRLSNNSKTQGHLKRRMGIVFETVIGQTPKSGSNPMWLTHAAESEYLPLAQHQSSPAAKSLTGCRFRGVMQQVSKFGASLKLNKLNCPVGNSCRRIRLASNIKRALHFYIFSRRNNKTQRKHLSFPDSGQSRQVSSSTYALPTFPEFSPHRG